MNRGCFRPGPTRDIDERFWEKVHLEDQIFPENGCMLWTASKLKGYGRFGVGGKYGTPQYAHRWAYERYRGPVPDGMELDHLCRVRHCVNPDHLEVVTRKINLNRGRNFHREKTHCTNGHEFTPTNTYVYQRGAWICRICRACKNSNARRYAKQASRDH